MRLARRQLSRRPDAAGSRAPWLSRGAPPRHGAAGRRRGAARRGLGSASSMARNVKRPHTLELLGPSRRTSSSCTATATSATIRRSSLASPHRRPAARCSWATRRAPRRRRTSGATSACPIPRAIARRSACSALAERLRPAGGDLRRHARRFAGRGLRGARRREAIARSIMAMTGLRTPIVTVITGEGGSRRRAGASPSATSCSRSRTRSTR